MASESQTTEAETPEQGAFRERARAWLAENATPRRVVAEDDETRAHAPAETDLVTRVKEFQPRLHDAGFAGITWPSEYGGQGFTNREQQIFNEEAAGYELPSGVLTIGLGMCGPTILSHGTERQKQRYIRPMLRAEEIWCQMFSEPGAGSDVAGLQSRAVRDGDEWVLNGQKVWTSGAHYCDFGIVIARTDPDLPKHRGITMFVLDMHAPGVTVKPLRQMNGASNFNEVFFDDVRIPADEVLGEVNEGWRASITTLMNERVAIGAGGGGGGGRGEGIRNLLRMAKERGLDADPVIRQELAELYIRQTVLGYIGLRIRAAVRSGKVPGPEGSIAKLASAQISKRSAGLGMAIAGVGGAAWDDEDRRGSRWAQTLLSAPSSSIAGGTDEVQRNIIGERVLGLPKDPQVDRDIPFREVLVNR